jgi:hypothetical protein
MGEFDFSVWGPSLPFIRDGLLFTLRLTLIAMTGGIVIGTLLALARLSPIKPAVAGGRRLCRHHALDPAGAGDPLVLPGDSLPHRHACRRRDLGHHHLHRLRGRLLLRDHALGHPERAARPGPCRAGAGADAGRRR